MSNIPKNGKSAIQRILEEDAKDIILSGYVGSISHGTYRPKKNVIDDKDVMGIFVPSEDNYLGLSCVEHINKFVGEWDTVFYEIRKFVRLLLNNNPNVLGLLWLENTMYIHRTEAGEELIRNRDKFLSKRCYKTFCGYAYSQLYKMENNACMGYMGDKRKRLVEKYGYDTKNASHLIRLLEMGIEALTEGKINVWRPNNAKLVAIKDGQFSLEQIKDEADELFKEMRSAYVRSKLPDDPDQKSIEKILICIIKNKLYGK